MSLFRRFMHDFDDDPFFGEMSVRKKNSISYTVPADDDDDDEDRGARTHSSREKKKNRDYDNSSHMNPMSQMNSMMNSMFADPFGMLDGFGGMGHRSRAGPAAGAGRQMMPFGFPNMNDIFQNFQMNMNDPNCHSFSSSTIVTMSSGADGRPQVYQASQSTRTAPGGVRETKKSVCDSVTGTKKLAIGHHIGERSHIKEREQNLHSGQVEEREDFINLEEEEAADFNREWETKARSGSNAIGYDQHRIRNRRPREDIPAILDRYRPHSYVPRSRLSSRRHYPALTSSSRSEKKEAKEELDYVNFVKDEDVDDANLRSSQTTSEKGKKRTQEEKNSESSDEEGNPGKKSCKMMKSRKKTH